MNAYIKCGEIMLIRYQDIEQKQIFGINQGPLLGKNVGKMICNKLCINAHTKFGYIL